MQLQAKTPTENRLKEYLDAHASDALKAKIAALPDRFNLDAAWRYIEEEARKALKGRSGCIEDETVFGWLVHYYEDVAPAEAARPAPAKAKEEAKPRSARKGASDRKRQPAAAAGSSKRRTEKEGRLVSASNGVSLGTPSTAQGVARPSPDSASSAPPESARAGSDSPETGGGAASSPEPSAASEAPSPPPPQGGAGSTDGAAESTAEADGSGFSFALFEDPAS